MVVWLIFLSFFCSAQLYASNTYDFCYQISVQKLCDQELIMRYSSSETFKEESAKAINEVRDMIEKGDKLHDILKRLGCIRASLKNTDKTFGIFRKTALFTPCHNYFVMRDCVLDILNSNFIFNANGPLSDTEMFLENGYSVRLFPALSNCQNYFFKMIEKLPKDKMNGDGDEFEYEKEWEKIKNFEALFEDQENAVCMFATELPWHTMEEFLTRGFRDNQRYEEAYAGLDYITYSKFLALNTLGKSYILKGQSAETYQNYFQMLAELEKTNPGQIIELKRQFLGTDAQKIFILKHPRAKAWKDCLFVLMHTKAENISLFDQPLEEAFLKAKEETDPQELQKTFYKFEFILSTQTPYFRGSSAIKEWFVSALYLYRGYKEPQRRFCETDQYAQILPLEDFIEKMSNKDGPLKPLESECSVQFKSNLQKF